MKLTPRQASILAHIEACVAKDGLPPTIREIGVVFGLTSKNGIHDHLAALERKRRIVVAYRLSRGITVLSPLTDYERKSFKLGIRRDERVTGRVAPPTHRLVTVSRCSVCGAAVFCEVCPMCWAEVAA